MDVDPTTYAAPAFLVLLFVEWRYLRSGRRVGDREALGFERRDTVASLGMGLVSVATTFGWQLGVFVIATWLYQYRLFELGSDPVAWVIALVAWDFAFYWWHRLSHVVRLFWASHVNHHSSERFNLSTALRQEWTPMLDLLVFPLLALFGIRPEAIFIAHGIDLIYQFWIHTEAIGRMPRWFEYALNTPSNHRVHHGSQEQYLDRNYAGILMIWDRMFGTFEPEGERVTYGLTKNIGSFNLLTIAFHEYAAMARDVRSASSWRERVRYVFAHPGWVP